MLVRRTAPPVRRWLAATTAAAGLAAALVVVPALDAPAGAAGSAASTCSTVRVAAHRGSHDAAHPENTLRSAALAVQRGAYAVEGDLQLTKDDVWVVIHDSTVDRTTDGRGRVADLTAAQVSSLHTNDGVLGGVPTVAQLLDQLDASPSTKMQLEIKPADVPRPQIRSLLQLFAAHKAAKRLMITSFHGAPLTTVRSYSPGWSTALISTTAVSAAAARPYGDKVVVEQNAITATYVSQMRGAGFVVWAWTVDSKAGYDAVTAAGVNGVVTNKLLSSNACWA